MKINAQTLKQEILDIIGDFYGLPEEEMAMVLYFRIDIAIAASEVQPEKPKLKGLAKVLGKKKRKKK